MHRLESCTLAGSTRCTAQTFAGTFVIAWAQRVPTGQLLGGWKLRHVVPYLSEKGHSIDPRVSCPSEPPLATAPAFVGRCPPGVLRAKQFRVPQTVFNPVNAEAESDDGNGSFLREQVVIGIFIRRRPRAREARCSGLSSPVMMSSSMACPLLPRTLVAMLASFTFASSSTF